MRNPRINLLFIVSSLCVGGAEKHLVTLLNNLDITRFRLSLAYLKDNQAQLPLIDMAKLEGRVTACDVSKRIDLRVVRELAHRLDDDAIDIIVCVNTYPLLYAWLARTASRRNARIVEIFHTTEIQAVKHKLQMLFYRPFFRICDTLVYVCENQKKFWRARVLRSRTDTVIHNGIDVSYFADRYSADEKALFRRSHGFSDTDYVVGLCAAMRPEKAHGDLLQAVAQLRAANVNIKCLLIGDGPDRSKIEAQIEAMGLAEHVRITGFMADIRLAVATCDVMAIVSHYIETFSIATLEAMALGKPVIMSNIGGAGEQIVQGVNGYLYNRGDITALANALMQLQSAEANRRMGDQARLIVSNRFSLAVMISAYDRLLVDLARPHRLPVEAEARDAI
jgi:glycosyltransferase involved in cell wall biosynthesis